MCVFLYNRKVIKIMKERRKLLNNRNRLKQKTHLVLRKVFNYEYINYPYKYDENLS